MATFLCFSFESDGVRRGLTGSTTRCALASGRAVPTLRAPHVFDARDFRKDARQRIGRLFHPPRGKGESADEGDDRDALQAAQIAARFRRAKTKDRAVRV